MSDNKRLAKNTIVLYVRTIVVLIISLLLSRFLLQFLGVEDYGIYNVVGGIIILFTFISNTLTQACQRFISFEIGKGNEESIQKVFSSSLSILLVTTFVIVLLLETIGVWFLNSKLNIPDDRVEAANILYQFVIISFVFTTFRIPYDATIIAHERMSFYAYINIAEAVLKLLSVLSLSFWGGDRLVEYGFLLLCISALVLLTYIIYTNKIFGTCKFRICFDKESLASLSSYMGWTLLGSGANVATQQGLVFLLNIYYGVILNAAMGIANQVSSAINAFVASFQAAFRPQIIKSYAVKDYDRLYGLINSTSRISFALIFIPSVVVILNTPYLLNIWLVNPPDYSIIFCRLIIVCSIIDAFTGPYYCAIMATGMIKLYQIYISINFCLDLFVIYALIKMGVSPDYLFYSRIATRGILNMFVGIYFMKKTLKFDVHNHIVKVIKPITIVVLLSLPLIFLTDILHGFQLLIASFFIVMIYCGGLCFVVLFEKSERLALINYVLGRKN